MIIQLETPSMFEFLLHEVAKEGKIEFEIDKYTFLFGYARVTIGTISRAETEISDLSRSIINEEVKSLVFDIIGLHDVYATQIEVTRNIMYVRPSRPVEKIQLFQKIMKEKIMKEKEEI